MGSSLETSQMFLPVLVLPIQKVKRKMFGLWMEMFVMASLGTLF